MTPSLQEPSPDEPCGPWPVQMDCCGWDPDPSTWTAQQRLIVQVASTVLWRLTAGRFGLCEETVRPCSRDCAGQWLDPWRWDVESPYTRNNGGPYMVDGKWFNRCGCSGPCGCANICQVTLPGPIAQVLEVKQDGQPLDLADFVVQDRRWLIRNDGQCWPDCQNVGLPDTEQGTWSVRYLRGDPVPADGISAVSSLACELWKQCTGAAGCRLPERVTQVDREGVSFTLIDPKDFASAGRTGLEDVDGWLAAVNPNSLHSPPGVWTPDLKQTRSEPVPAIPQPRQGSSRW